jgi:hypothetical protein
MTRKGADKMSDSLRLIEDVLDHIDIEHRMCRKCATKFATDMGRVGINYAVDEGVFCSADCAMAAAEYHHAITTANEALH